MWRIIIISRCAVRPSSKEFARLQASETVVAGDEAQQGEHRRELNWTESFIAADVGGSGLQGRAFCASAGASRRREIGLAKLAHSKKRSGEKCVLRN